MTMLMTDATSDYDGSGSPISATGPIKVTFSGTLGAGTNTLALTCYSRSDTADFVPTYNRPSFGRFTVNLSSGDDYYFVVNGVKSTDSIDLSVVDA